MFLALQRQSTPSFLSSSSKRVHLLRSLSTLTFKGLEPSVTLTLLSGDYRLEILRGEDADGLTQGAGTEFLGNSAVPRHPWSTAISGLLELWVNVIGTLLVHWGIISLREEGSNSASVMSARLVSSRKRHSSLVRVPGERTKVGHHGCPLEQIRVGNVFVVYCF